MLSYLGRLLYTSTLPKVTVDVNKQFGLNVKS